MGEHKHFGLVPKRKQQRYQENLKEREFHKSHVTTKKALTLVVT